MTRGRLICVVASVVVSSSPWVLAQESAETRQEILLSKRREKAQKLTPYRVSSIERRILGFEKARFPQNIFVKGFRGVRPVVGGMPPGSGFAGGAGYIRGLESEYFQLQANGRYSTRGYRQLDAEALFPPPQMGRRFELSVGTAYRDLTSLRFFGLGNGSSADDRSTYLLRDTRVRGALWINPRGLLSFGVESGFLRVETGPGKAGRSLETVFDPAEVTGFGVPRTEYSVVGGWAEFDVREKSVDPAVGVVARITALRYDDRDLNLFDFTRLVGDVKVYIPLGHRNRIFALRFRTSHSTADRGDQVPFYLMETLGGPTTIRGFRQYRFRDTRNLLLNVEYRWEVWTYLDFSFFFDAGKVFSDEDDFDFSGLHTGYGFGMRAHAPGDVRFRIDLARSREGFKLHIGGGPSF